MRRTLSLIAVLAVAAGLLPQSAGASVAFGPGARLLCPSNPATALCERTGAKTEPYVLIDRTSGTVWVSDQSAIPSGGNLWRRKPGATGFEFVGKIDEIPAVSQRRGLAAGGGDTDLALSTDGSIYATSLWGGGLTFAAFNPDGTLIQRNYLSSGKPNVDREWTASYGQSTAYVYHWDLAGMNHLWVSRTDDKGLTWLPPVSVIDGHGIGTAETIGNLITDPDGTVFAVYGDGGGLWVARCSWTVNACADDSFPGGTRPTFENVKVQEPTTGAGTPGTRFGTLFPVIASDVKGNLYLTWSDKNTLWFASSTDHGSTWTTPRAIDDGGVARSKVFPWITAGSEGRVGIAFLGSDRTDPEVETGSPWFTYYVQSIDALDAEPTFSVTRASDDAVHNADVCLRGLNCDLGVEAPEPIQPGRVPVRAYANNRNLAEVVTVAIDADGLAMIAYPDDFENNRTVATRSVVVDQIAGEPLLLPEDR